MARKSAGWSTEDELRALIAERLADSADRAAADGDATGFTRAADKLLDAITSLPIRPPGGGDPVGADDDRGRVLQLMDSPPQVGDAADA